MFKINWKVLVTIVMQVQIILYPFKDIEIGVVYMILWLRVLAILQEHIGSVTGPT